ncbi:accessory Sec system protein Asp2 [Fructobacillus cardui]|uniref:accessory Sec system protein Asp2 n=1 Tax=Fructobacillus cardui TaxID=2893170 RepID=UPI002D8FDE56|nr:DUF1100 family (FrsA) [Fructobacillus cardui]
MAQMSILQIGEIDWTEQVQNENLDWHYTASWDLPFLLARQQDPSFLAYTYVLLTDSVIDSTVLARQIREWPAYRVIYLGNAVGFNWELKQALDDRGAFYFHEKKPEEVANRIFRDLYLGQAGFPTRFSETQFLPVKNYCWQLKRSGRFSTAISGDFGDDYQQIGTFKTFPGDYQPGQENLVYCDYEQTGDAELALCFVFYHNGNLQQLQMIQGPAMQRLTAIKAPASYQDYQILVLAKGKGSLDLHNVHQRRSRHGLGYFLPGGRRDMTEDGQEVLSYFNPGTKKGPLVVLFVGTRLYVEGFEMMGPLSDLGYPYLLFTDSRTQGGAFMVGNEEYEDLVTEKIRSAQETARVTADELILTGYSMGSYAAMYYAGKVAADHLVLAKPIINLGTFTARGDFAHSGVNHDWILDVRYLLTGRLDQSDTKRLDQKLWHSLNQLTWRNGEVSLFTMTQDEYDGESLPKLLDYFRHNNVTVNRQQMPGHHEDQVDAMVEFLKKEISRQAKAIKQEGWR